MQHEVEGEGGFGGGTGADGEEARSGAGGAEDAEEFVPEPGALLVPTGAERGK